MAWIHDAARGTVSDRDALIQFDSNFNQRKNLAVAIYYNFRLFVWTDADRAVMPGITDITWTSSQMQDRASVAETIETLCRILAWVSLAAIAFVTVAPLELRPTSGLSPQIERLAAFAVVGALFSAAYSRHIWIAAAVVIGAAVLLELLQLLAPSRHGRLFDASIKTVGAMAGLTAGYMFAKRILRR